MKRPLSERCRAASGVKASGFASQVEDFDHSRSKLQAANSARRTSGQRSSDRLHNTAPKRSRWPNETRSKFTAQAVGMPSSSVGRISVRNSRMMRVTGATMISFRRSITSFRVSTRNRAAFVGKPECVPADLAADQRNSSHPSAPRASGSSSLENSSRAGGATL